MSVATVTRRLLPDMTARVHIPVLPAIGAVLLLGFVITAVLAPLIAPYDPSAYVGSSLEPPSTTHPLGTNDVGQDILSELIYGARVSLIVAVVAGTLSLAIALTTALTAGYAGGIIDTILMRIVDVFFGLPRLPLMIVLAVFLGPGLENVILVIVVLAWIGPARVMRSQVLSLRERGHIRASELFGGGRFYVIRRHLLPAIAPIAASALVSLAGRAVMMEAGLAFLGIGDPTLKSWGTIMRFALDYGGIYLTSVWTWWLLPPAICITLLVVSFTFLGTMTEEYANARVSRHR